MIPIISAIRKRMPIIIINPPRFNAENQDNVSVYSPEEDELKTDDIKEKSEVKSNEAV